MAGPCLPTAWVWIVTGVFVAACARATERSTCSTPAVRPLASTAHLSMPALTPVPAMPSVMSRTKNSVMADLRAAPEEHRHLVERVAAGGDDDVQAGHLFGYPLDAGDVAALADHGDVDDRADPVLGEFAQARDGVGDAGVLVAPFFGVVPLHVGGQHEDVLVHQRAAEGGGVHRAEHRLDLSRRFHTGIFPHRRRVATWCWHQTGTLVGLMSYRRNGMSIFVLLLYSGYAVGKVTARFRSSTVPQ